MKQFINQSRRNFLKANAAAGGGLLMGFYLPAAGRFAQAAAPEKIFSPNAWIRIGTDDIVTIIVDKSEMGQGVLTSLPMIAAEELDADWNKIRIESAPADPAYTHPWFGVQGTGGSTSVRASWEPLRKAGAAARQMLLAAAAETWEVAPDTCRTENSTVIHAASGRKLGYGGLARRAAELPVPKEVKLKAPSQFRLIGKPLGRLDTPEKTSGKAVFAGDVKLPGMLTAVVARCPVFGGKVGSFNAEKAKTVKGVRHVVRIDSGIAVVAEGFWPAKLGRDALEIKWDEGSNAKVSSTEISRLYAELAQKPGLTARKEGDVEGAKPRAAMTLSAVYEVPYLAHAPMEPMSCVAHVKSDGVEIWAGTQAQSLNQGVAATITDLPLKAVKVHTTMLGGGFGRRFHQDFVAEAVRISKAVRAPVKLIWTREDDMRHGVYRPATYGALSAGIDANAAPLFWTHRIVSPSVAAAGFPSLIKDQLDPTSVEGAADLPYAIPNIYVDCITQETGVPVWFWRSVGHSQNAYISESFFDEVAQAAGKDPYQLRRALLSKHPRLKAVLELAAEKAGWGSSLPKGRGSGIAVHESFGSFVAQVAEVSVSQEGKVRVHRVVCAIDCGTVVNPDTVKAQMESGIVYGLTAALYGAITIKDGRVEQSNFHDYPMLRMNEMPAVEVHIVKSSEPPGGVGEPGTPPIAPAVVNAIFAATGKRIRKLPINQEELRKT